MFDDENSIAAKHREDDGDEAFYRRERAKVRKAMDLATFCADCGAVPELTVSGYQDAPTFSVWCGCGWERQGYGKTAAIAVEHWNAENTALR